MTEATLPFQGMNLKIKKVSGGTKGRLEVSLSNKEDKMLMPPQSYTLTLFESQQHRSRLRNKLLNHFPMKKEELDKSLDDVLAENYKSIQEVIRAEVEEDEEKIIRTCFYQNGSTKAQQILTEDGSAFLVYDGLTFNIQAAIEEEDGTVLKPLEGEEIQKGFIKLGTAPGEVATVAEIVQTIIELSRLYVDVPEWFREFAAYYVVFTWIYDKGNTTPYLRFMGDTGAGKTRGLDVFGPLCYNAINTSGAATTAPFFRIIDKWRGTPLIEEGDLKGSDQTNEMVKVINCGIERDKPVMRCDPNEPDKVMFFDVFGPKVFATRFPFQDIATESRCLTCDMEETERRDIPPVLPGEFYGEAQKIRNQLVTWRLMNYDSLKPASASDLPENLEPRLRQMGLPLMVLFEGRDDPAFLRFADFLKSYQLKLREVRANSFPGQVVATLLDFIEERNEEDNAPPIITKDIAERLKVSGPDVSRELRALGFLTETRHKNLKDERGKTKRKAFRAIVCPEKAWNKTIRKYTLEGEYELPERMRPRTRQKSLEGEGQGGAP